MSISQLDSYNWAVNSLFSHMGPKYLINIYYSSSVFPLKPIPFSTDNMVFPTVPTTVFQDQCLLHVPSSLPLCVHIDKRMCSLRLGLDPKANNWNCYFLAVHKVKMHRKLQHIFSPILYWRMHQVYFYVYVTTKCVHQCRISNETMYHNS